MLPVTSVPGIHARAAFVIPRIPVSSSSTTISLPLPSIHRPHLHPARIFWPLNLNKALAGSSVFRPAMTLLWRDYRLLRSNLCSESGLRNIRRSPPIDQLPP